GPADADVPPVVALAGACGVVRRARGAAWRHRDVPFHRVGPSGATRSGVPARRRGPVLVAEHQRGGRAARTTTHGAGDDAVVVPTTERTAGDGGAPASAGAGQAASHRIGGVKAPSSIHQVTAVFADRDAVGGHVVEMQTALRDLGYSSEIF